MMGFDADGKVTRPARVVKLVVGRRCKATRLTSRTVGDRKVVIRFTKTLDFQFYNRTLNTILKYVLKQSI